MSYSFKYNRTKGVYEVLDGKKVEMECSTMQEAQTYISTKVKKPVVSKKPALTIVKEVIGFGPWGTPKYLLKAESGNYGVKGD